MFDTRQAGDFILNQISKSAANFRTSALYRQRSGTVIFHTRSHSLKLFLSNSKSMPLLTLTGSRGLFCLSFSFPELIHRTVPARQMRILKQPLCCLYQGNISFQIENNSGTQAPAGSGYIPKSFSYGIPNPHMYRYRGLL